MNFLRIASCNLKMALYFGPSFFVYFVRGRRRLNLYFPWQENWDDEEEEESEKKPETTQDETGNYKS